MQRISMTVNDKAITADVEGRTLLVEFLRETLNLTGTHVGCDTSQCGACTVHVDGLAVKSCTIFVGELEGAEILTIEGIEGTDGTFSPLQQAFQDHHGLQCGYCTPGMIMSLTSLLSETPKPTEAQIRHHLEGNICRCTGYTNIVKAVQAASGQLESTSTDVH
jgi:aerobic carbon-monoxide dehydrogenase small subunit